MRRAIVHIGMPRSGTTTLQRALYVLRPRLAKRGILYPDLTPKSAAATPHISHQHLGEVLDGRRPPVERRELFERLDHAIRETEADVLILSYEGLSQMPHRRSVAKYLDSFLARRGFSTELLVTLKQQSAYLNSTYTHRVQFLTEHRAFAPFLKSTVGASRYDYEAVLQPWLAAGSGKVVHAVPLADRRSDAPLLTRVFSELGLLDRLASLLEPAILTIRENKSPNAYAIEAERRLRLGGAHSALRDSARDATLFLENLARDLNPAHGSFQGVTDEHAALIQDRFRLVNDRFALRVWGEPWQARVADADSHPVNELADRPLGAEDRDILDLLIQRTGAQFGVTLKSGLPAVLANIDSAARSWSRFLRYGLRVATWIGIDDHEQRPSTTSK